MIPNVQVLNSYEKCVSHPEIINAFNRIDSSKPLMLWQNYNNERRILWARNWNFDTAEEKIAISHGPDDKITLHLDRALYIKLPFREAILKCEIESSDDESVLIRIPDELFWQELRGTPRTFFPFQEKMAQVRPNLSRVSPEKLSIYQVFVKDISHQGIGLIVSETNMVSFKPGQLLELMNLGDNKLLSPKIGQIIYCVKEDQEKNSKASWFRVGIKMLKPFSDEILSAFNEKTVNQPAKPLPIDCFSEEFKKNVEKEVTVTLEKMKKNQAIVGYLQQLELSRQQDDYLDEHIEILCILCTYMARSMGWFSDIVMQKLIYVCYMHDAPLFQCPKLAKIPNLKNFEKLKSSLTQAEQNLFLSAPGASRDIAFSDHSAPPDAVTILMMQKELPDGKGFPRKIYANKIIPMAALFILAHDLTDEILNNSEWSFEGWLKKASLTFKGGSFAKTLETLENLKFAFKKPKKSQ